MRTWKTKRYAYARSFRIDSGAEFHGWRGVWMPHHARKRFAWWVTDRFDLRTEQGRRRAAERGVRGL